MELYVIRRRNAWKTPQELEEIAARSRRIGNEEMPDRVRWIRSYVVKEDDGRLGTVCIYQATDAAAIHDHARRVGMPADEITPVFARSCAKTRRSSRRRYEAPAGTAPASCEPLARS